MEDASVAVHGTPPSTIFFDITELVVLDLRTGIQRVVLEMLKHGADGASRLPVVPVIAVGTAFHPLSEVGWQRIDASGSGVGEKRITHERGVSPLVRAAKRIAKFNAAFYNQLQRVHIRRLIRRRSQGLYLPEPAPLGPGSTLVLLDSFWGGSSTIDAARVARGRGALVVLAVHDLIPVSHPQFCDYRLVQKFGPLMAQAVRISDRVLANSQFTADEFQKMFPRVGITPFPLGHDLRQRGSVSGGSWPDELWAGDDPVFVVIGSIEPRKGHQAILDAFERRWARGERDKLLILGKVGWQVDELMRRIDNHPEAGRRLFHVFDGTDGMLKDALARAKGGIIASFIEGFGLPLVEILATGLPALASNIPVFHEIAGDCAIYFEPGDPIALDEAIGLLHSRYEEQHERVARFVWPDWREAAELFFARVEGRPIRSPLSEETAAHLVPEQTHRRAEKA